MTFHFKNPLKAQAFTLGVMHGVLLSVGLGFGLSLSLSFSSIAQDLNKCANHANITREIAELKQRGLSRSEIKQNLTEIMKLKNNSQDTLHEWMLSLDWLYQREHVRLSPQLAQAQRLDECKRELGIIEWK
jgi:hypothetical protein